MTYELSEIKDIRKKLGLTQGQLAKRAGVSQSLIAKIEAGRIDPTFSKTKKIFEVIDSLSKKAGAKVSDIMNRKIIPVAPTDNIKLAIKKMRKHEISQMPVVKDDAAVGLVTEATIVNKMVEIDDPAKLVSLTVGDVMEECPPIISKNAGMDAVSTLLKHYAIVLVSDSGKLIGIVTKSDILGRLYKA